jgi:hypothetical protein
MMNAMISHSSNLDLRFLKLQISIFCLALDDFTLESSKGNEKLKKTKKTKKQKKKKTKTKTKTKLRKRNR